MLFETLEPRRLFAVTVVEGYPGFFEVHGDDDANSITISVNMDERTFTLDGLSYSNVNFISVWGYDGQDAISVATASPFATISAVLHGGNDNDSLSLNFDGAVWGDDGNDTMFLRHAFRGEAHAGIGDDSVFLSGENIEAVVYGNAGDDVLSAGQNNHGIYMYGGSGNDYINGSPHADYLDGGNGRDTIHGGGGSDTVHGGNGDDRFIGHYDQQQVLFVGGDGIDEVYNYYGTMTVWGVEQLYY
jgi:Ca2+-binding RTX toxin-like protein